MVDAEKALKDYAKRHADEPFTAAQARGGQQIGEPALKRALGEMVMNGELVGLPSGRYLYTNNADIAAYHIMREVAPNISFEEFISHRDEPHLLVRASRDREILKDPRGGI
jgi:hypothetical protein